VDLSRTHRRIIGVRGIRETAQRDDTGDDCGKRTHRFNQTTPHFTGLAAGPAGIIACQKLDG